MKTTKFERESASAAKALKRKIDLVFGSCLLTLKPNETIEEYRNHKRAIVVDFMGVTYIFDKRKIYDNRNFFLKNILNKIQNSFLRTFSQSIRLKEQNFFKLKCCNGSRKVWTYDVDDLKKICALAEACGYLYYFKSEDDQYIISFNSFHRVPRETWISTVQIFEDRYHEEYGHTKPDEEDSLLSSVKDIL